MTEIEQSAWNYDIVVPIIFGVGLLCCGIYLCILLVQEIKTLKKNKEKQFNMIQKYRKKPVVVEAIQYTWDKAKDVYDFIGEENIFVDLDACKLYVKTLEGKMLVSPNDYVIKGVNGEFYPCKPDIFEKTYEKVD